MMLAAPLRSRYDQHVANVEQVMLDEVRHWPWAEVHNLERMVRAQLQRHGKRLRPILGLIMADLMGGALERVYAGAASSELYHTASIILDDIQDNSALRQGSPTVHVSASASIAINLAATIRSLTYHPIHRSSVLSDAEKLQIHRRLDAVATLIPLGQSIDIGWHAGWYRSLRDFPYEQMIRRKTGALFGYAAWVGAFVSVQNPALVEEVETLGTEVGVLYQLLDDYLDVFGEHGAPDPPLQDDLRDGKLTYPLIVLLDCLQATGKTELAAQVFRQLKAQCVDRPAQEELMGLMREWEVDRLVRQELHERTEKLAIEGDRLRSGGVEPDYLRLFLQSILNTA